MTWWGWTLSGTAVWLAIAAIAGRFIAAVIAFGGHPPDWPPEWEPDDDPGDDGVYADARAELDRWFAEHGEATDGD